MDQVKALREDVEKLTGEVRKLGRAFRSRTVALVVITAAFCLAALLAVHTQAENERRIEENNQRWCPLFTALNPPGTPATTPRGRVVTERLHDLAAAFNCPTN